MTFLAPIAGLVATALTVPALIAFYLLKLRRRPVRVGSVMFWERAVRDAQGNAPWRMVRPQTQLFLQLLGLALLLLAFARPVVPGELGGRVMLVLDRSASMQATDGVGGATRFDEAKDALRSIAADLASASDTQVMVVALASEALPLTPWTSDRSVLLGALFAVEPTDEEASSDALAELVRLAATGDDASLGGDGVATAEREPRALMVVLASDGDLPAPAEPLPANVALRLEPVGGRGGGTGGASGGSSGGGSGGEGGSEASATSNAGLTAVAAQRLYDDPAAVRVFARVEATGDLRRPLPVRLALDGRVVAESVVDLSPGERAGQAEREQQDEAGGAVIATVGLSTVWPDAGVLSVLLPGGDALGADDSASLWLRSAGRPRVLQVIPDDEVVDPDRPGPVLLVAAVLEAMDLGSLRIERLSRYEQWAAGGDLPFDAIVFDRVAPGRPPPVASLHLGAAPPGLADSGARWRAAEPGAVPSTRVVSWRRSHPIMRDLALDQLAVARPLIERADSGLSTEGPSAAGAVVLASGERGPLIVAFEGGQHRRVWVGFEPALSNWPKLVSFPLFIAEAIDYLSMRGVRDAAEASRAGEIATMALAQPRTRVRLDGPGGALELTSSTPTARPAIGPIERAGVYLLESPNPGDQRAIAVNVSSELESRVGVRAELPAAFGGMPESQAGAARRGGEQELWPWFVLAGLLVLTLEWFLSARSLGR